MGIEESMIPIVYALINISHTLIGIPAGMLADKIGKEIILTIGYFVFVVTILLLIFLSGNQLYAYVIALIFGLYIGIIETVQRAIIPKFVSSELRGTGFGLYYSVVGASFFICNVTFGYLWDNCGFNMAASYSLSFSAISIIGMLIFMRFYSNFSYRTLE